jgi:tetratricopeptide (TPR) repeat protein
VSLPKRNFGVFMNVSPVPKEVRLFILIEQTFRIAAGLQEQGRTGDADQLYQFILAINPKHFGSLFQLATIRARGDQLDVAIELFRQASDADPTSADAMAGLGAALAVDGHRDEAITWYEKALSVDADHAGARYALAATLHALGRTEEAIPLFERAIEIRPDYAEAHFGFANLLQGINRAQEGIPHYEKAIELQPRRIEAYNNLGNALLQLGRGEEAIAQYQKALAIDPDHLEARFSLGNALLSLNRSEEAIEQNRKIFELDPTKVGALNNIGVALHRLGRLSEADEAYERALLIAPRQVSTHLNLAHLRRFTADDPRLRRLEEIAGEMPTLEAGDQISLHFALAKAYEDLNQHEQCFGHLREGNAIKRRQLSYDESAVLDMFQRIRTIFTRDLVRQKSGAGDASRVPVFVVGMPRSGTSLLEQILASHSGIFGAGETGSFARAVAPFRHPETEGGEFPEMVSTLSAQDLNEIGSAYLNAVQSLAPDMARIVNKLPMNFMFAGLIHLALPNAKIIHARRDPMDTCFSCYSLVFTGNQPFSYDLGELGRYYRGYEALMAHWHEVLPKGVMIDVQYEALVDDIEGQARAMIAHCGLEWEDACLSFHETERSVRTASAVQVRAPVYRSSIGRWRAYEKFLQPLVEALNPAAPATAEQRELDHAPAA